MYSREELDLIWNILDNIKNDGYIHGQDIRKLAEFGIPYLTLSKVNADMPLNEFLQEVYKWACNPYNPNEENDKIRINNDRRLDSR